MMKLSKNILPGFAVIVLAAAAAWSCTSRVDTTGAIKVKTTFQTSREWRATIDNRADAVMVYGVGNRDTSSVSAVENRIKTWKERGYKVDFMTGIAWGGYQDYFTGEWDGEWHLDEGQVQVEGDTIWHGKMVPYIVPTKNYLNYFKETQVKRVIDAGIDALYFE